MREWFFRRYRNGERMAEDVRITQAATLEEASLAASRIAAQYRDGTVLVSECEVDLRAELAAERERTKAIEEELDLREQEDCNEENYLQSQVDKLTAERDALRALLREAREYTGYAAYGDRIEADHAVDLCARIDAALNEGGGNE